MTFDVHKHVDDAEAVGVAVAADDGDDVGIVARSLEGALIPDRALPDASEDALGHDAFAGVIADLVMTVESPANVALFGPWGSGKSSLYGMVEARVAPPRRPWKPWPWQPTPGVRMVRYDAWKFAGQSLQRNFLSLLASELNVSQRLLDRMYGARETSRLRLGRYLWRNKWSLLLALFAGVVVAALWTILSAWAAHRWGVGVQKPVAFKAGVVKALPSGGVVLGAVLAALLLGNQAMASAVEKRSQSPLQDADQFSAAFDRMMKVVTRRRLWWWLRVKRLVVFIDELDRCQPHEVVTTLRDLMTFLDHKHCVFLVAADREVLEEALEQAPQVKPLRENEPYYSTAGAFLDKVFQHQMPLPPTRAEALTVYARTLADQRGGLWARLRAVDEGTYDDVVYSLVPTHIRSPRRVKVLMNNFVTSTHVLEARGMHWVDRAAEVAVLTVLQTEFPSVVRDFLQEPRLLDGLVGVHDDMSPELADMVRKYTADPDRSEDLASPSPLMTGGGEKAVKSEQTARRRLNEQLAAYLGRVHAAAIPLPSPDLIYAQTAAHAEGLADESLARILDIAADTAPDTVVAAFASASATDRQAAVRFLVAQLGSKFGPLRDNLVESACRIATTLDYVHARDVARFAASAILNEARTTRWRTGATAGALWLGLLDTQIPDPLTLLQPSGDLAELAESEALATLVPLLPDLGDRATALFPFLGEAYDQRPHLLHEALQNLTGPVATRLWASEGTKVTDWYDAVRLEPSPVSTNTLAVSTLTTAPAATERLGPTLSELAVDRYAALLTSLCERTSPDVSPVVAAVAKIGVAKQPISTLYDVLWDKRHSVFEAISDPADRSGVALTAIAHAANPGAEELLDWSAQLDGDTQQSPLLVAEAAIRVAELLTGTTAGASTLTDGDYTLAVVLRRCAPFLTKPVADDVAAVFWKALVANPPDGQIATVALRARARAGLAVLDTRFSDTFEHKYFLGSYNNMIDQGQITSAGASDLLNEVEKLPRVEAIHLHSKITSSTSAANDEVTLLRLRIAARRVGALRPLPTNEFLAAVPSGPTGGVITEWLATTPSLSEVEKLLRRFLPLTEALSAYSRNKNINDRSKLWIALERTGTASHAHLEAIGRHGVNESVVAHMAPKIAGANLPEQTSATRRLITANLSTNTKAKAAANSLAITLLKSGIAGAGPNAARITLAANGAAPGRKPELKQAFDAYTSAPSQRIGNPDLRALNALGLLTPKKKSPLAILLGWRSTK